MVSCLSSKARISMVYAKHLREAGNHFMKTQLNYDPGNGNGRQAPRNGGGDFMSVHLRRRDYTYAHAGERVCVCVCVYVPLQVTCPNLQGVV